MMNTSIERLVNAAQELRRHEEGGFLLFVVSTSDANRRSYRCEEIDKAVEEFRAAVDAVATEESQ